MDNELLKQLHDVEFLMNTGEMEAAIKHLEDISHSYPDDYHVASLLGECYLLTGQPNRAIKPLRWATKRFAHEFLDDETEETQEGKASSSQHLTPTKKVKRQLPKKKKNSKEDQEEQIIVKELQKIYSEKQENNVWVDHYLLGCAYGRCLQFQPAIKHLNIADKLNPNNTEVIRNLGWIRCMQEKKQTGRTLLRRAISLDPTNALAYNDLGASYMFEENFEEAEKWIGKATEMDPNDEFIKNTADKLEDLVAMKQIFGQ